MSGRPERVTLADLKTALQRHYVREGNASWHRAEQAFTHLEDFFGAEAKALSITRSAVADYQDSRLKTKGGDDRAFPIGQAPELRDLLLERFRNREELNVFHRRGKPIGDFRKVWDKACRSAGVSGRLVHDLRRTAARDFRRAGLSEGEIMALCGWKTRDMFDRYNIIDSEDLSRAVAQRFNNGTLKAQNAEIASAADS